MTYNIMNPFLFSFFKDRIVFFKRFHFHFYPLKFVIMKNKFLLTLGFFLLMVISKTTQAQDGKWSQNHPRRTQVNHRLNNQNDRIHNKVKDGQMSKGEASKLHHEDHQIRTEERDMASQNHGHITKQEQKTLNQQENHVSNQIKNH
jgi:hypothetical protein